MEIDEGKITRLVVVNSSGRIYEHWKVKIKLHIGDEGRTLKVFVEGGKE